MEVQTLSLSPPPLFELAQVLRAPLISNYEKVKIDVVQCPDLRKPPFLLGTRGLSGEEKISEVGGPANAYNLNLDTVWSMVEIAKSMDMSPAKGGLIGAAGGPMHPDGQAGELTPNYSWREGFDNADNDNYVTIVESNNTISSGKTPSEDCSLMANLYGSSGEPGPVIHISVKKRIGTEQSFTELIRKGLLDAYGENQTISLGGAFHIKGPARYHVMPAFTDGLNFTNAEHVDEWLHNYNYSGPLVCLPILNTADPAGLDLRPEHTHCFSSSNRRVGGHYHYDLDGSNSTETVEYEAYLNTAKTIFRLDRAFF